MEQNTDDKTIISKLFVSQEKMTERISSLVTLSKDVISIVEETGDIHLVDAYKFNNNEKIFLFLLGTYFSWKSGLHNTPNMALSEIANKLTVPNSTIPSPLNKLFDEKLILKAEKGSYCINFDNYKRIKEMLEKIKEKNDKS